MNPKIAVFSGGISPEREVSLVSGENVFKALSKKFDAVSVRLDENALPSGIDPDEYVIFPAMHGDYGEDGTLQGQLDAAGFEYAGCGSLSSRACMVKPAAKALLAFAGLPVARSIEFRACEKPSASALAALFPGGCVVKPADKGSSVGLSVARDSAGAEKALSRIESGSWMAEELVKGREFSIGVIFGRAAGVVEIIPDGGIYDYKRKYTAGSTRYVYPAEIPERAASAMRAAAEGAFRACGCRDFARVDFIAADADRPDFAILEINTLPGMTPTSLLPKSASCAGYSFESLCETLVGGAVKRFLARTKR